MKCKISILGILLALSACNTPDTIFDFEASRLVEAEEINIDISKIGMPSTNILLIENNLILKDGKGDYSIKLIKLAESLEIIELGRKGRGPDEITFINGINRLPGNNESFYINDASKHRIEFYNVDSITKGRTKPDSVMSLLENRFVFEITPMGSDRFLAENISSSENYLALYDKDFNILSESFEYPFELKEALSFLDQRLQASALSARIRVSPNGSKIFAYLKYTDFIELFAIEEDNLESTFRSYTYMKEISVSSPTKYVYRNIRGGIVKGYCTNEYIYILAHNHSNKLERSEIFKGARQLFVFDWDAKPVDHIELDHDVLMFTVDDSDRFMYAFTYGKEETLLLKYDLTRN